MTQTTGWGDRFIRRVIAPGSLAASNQECWSVYFVTWVCLKFFPLVLKAAVVMAVIWVLMAMTAGLD
jgi:hypothetical protein